MVIDGYAVWRPQWWSRSGGVVARYAIIRGMRAPRNFKPDRCYHLISRIANRAFCLTEEERSRFVERLWRVAKFSGCEVPAYCRSVHTGTTWESRFRAREYRSDEKCTLLNAAVYIDRNPVKVKMSSWPERYEWCSFATVEVSSCGQGKEIGIVSYSTTLTPPLGSDSNAANLSIISPLQAHIHRAVSSATDKVLACV